MFDVTAEGGELFDDESNTFLFYETMTTPTHYESVVCSLLRVTEANEKKREDRTLKICRKMPLNMINSDIRIALCLFNLSCYFLRCDWPVFFS